MTKGLMDVGNAISTIREGLRTHLTKIEGRLGCEGLYSSCEVSGRLKKETNQVFVSVKMPTVAKHVPGMPLLVEGEPNTVMKRIFPTLRQFLAD